MPIYIFYYKAPTYLKLESVLFGRQLKIYSVVAGAQLRVVFEIWWFYEFCLKFILYDAFFRILISLSVLHLRAFRSQEQFVQHFVTELFCIYQFL
jgi:hypothetical protein